MIKPSKQNMLSLMPLLLFFVLALCVLFVSVMGINISKSIAERDSTSYALRTACQYTAVKVQSAPTKDAVTVGSFDGCDALVISESYGDREYLTRIYCHGGYLCELFAATDATLSPSDGEKLLKLESMSVSQNADILNICFTENGGDTKTLLISGVAK